MSTNPGTAASGARAELSAVDSARRAAVDGTRRPTWLLAAFAVVLGTAFGFALLRTPLGWVVGAVLFVVSIVGFLVVDSRLKRRRGRLLNLGGAGVLRFFVVYGVMFVIGQIDVPHAWQPWFAIAAGMLLALLFYIYLRWDDADTARRLATGNFDAADLMP